MVFNSTRAVEVHCAGNNTVRIIAPTKVLTVAASMRPRLAQNIKRNWNMLIQALRQGLPDHTRHDTAQAR